MNIEELKKEYETQDNRATAFPIYVQVQELYFIGVIDDECSVSGPYGDSEEIMEHDCDNCDKWPCWSEDREESEPEHCERDVKAGYAWIPVEFCLTIKGAGDYMQRNKHNHGRLRTYVDHFERRNYEMRGLLKEIGFKVKD